MLINDCVFFLKCIYTENLNKTVQQWRGKTAKETTHQESGWQWDVFEFQWLFNVNVIVLYLCSTVFLFRILWSQSSMTYFNICLVRYHRRFLCVCVCVVLLKVYCSDHTYTTIRIAVAATGREVINSVADKLGTSDELMLIHLSSAGGKKTDLYSYSYSSTKAHTLKTFYTEVCLVILF